MRLVRSILSVFVAVFWVAASSHVLLETAGFIHQEDHGQGTAGTGAHDDDDHDAADGKCLLASSYVTLSAPALVALFEIGRVGTGEFFCELVYTIEACGLAPPSDVSLSLSSWQFCRRTALPPRAPSFLS